MRQEEEQPSTSPSAGRGHPDPGAPAPHAHVASGLRVGAARACVIVPAYQARRTIEGVLGALLAALPEASPADLIVVDDGSSDGTSDAARALGVTVVVHPKNRGKGAALLRGLGEAAARGYAVALTVDADGQHPAASAREVLFASGDARALVLGVRNLSGAGAPRANQISNGISNFFLSAFAGRPLRDTQCGLRRYPVKETLLLGNQARGYAFEAEVLLRANAAGVPIVQKDVPVHYPPEDERVTHFHSVRDPARIIATVLWTTLHLSRTRPRAPRAGTRPRGTR